MPTVRENLRRIWQIFQQATGVFCSISGSAYLVIAVVSWILNGLANALVATLSIMQQQQDDASAAAAYGNSTDTNNNHAATSAAQEASMVNSVLGLIVFEVVVEYAIFYAIMCLADGAVIRAVAELYVGRTPDLQAVVQCSVRKLAPLVAVTFVLAACSLVPLLCMKMAVVRGHHVQMVLFLVFLIWFAVVTYLVYPVIMVEGRRGATASIVRSFYLVSGMQYWWYMFATLCVFGLTKMICLKIVGAGGSSSSITADASNGVDGDASSHHHLGFFGLIAVLIRFVVRVLFSCWGSMYVQFDATKQALLSLFAFMLTIFFFFPFLAAYKPFSI